MANSNDPQNYGKEVRKEIYSDTDGQTNITKTTETVNGANAYKDGYVNGQIAESYQEDVVVARDNENAGRGLLIGILLASLAAITAGAVWFANQSNDVNTITPVAVPVPNRVEPSPVPETKTEIRTIKKEVVVPQQQTAPAPQPSAATPQNINITVPPVTQPSPKTETAPPKSDTSSSSNTQSTTTTDAAPKSDTSSSPDTQSTTTTESSTTTNESSTETPATTGSN
jgi:outer membrane biosynthesis protein TonB